MDQIKIGKFIAERRKLRSMTQMQLAEKMGVSDRAVSKWERGKSMPDSSIMLELCAALGISVNDLLCGEVVTMENYNEKLEQQMLEMVKEKETSDKMLLRLEWVIGILSVLILLIPAIIGSYLNFESEKIRLAIVLSGFIPALVGIFFAVRIEQIAGYYECRCCGHRYVPTYKAVNLAMHMGRTRYMRCPECGKRSWQRKVIKKED